MVDAGDKLSFSITTTAKGVATQKVWQNGELVSQQTDTMIGMPLYAYGTTECFTGSGGACGSMEAYSKFYILLFSHTLHCPKLHVTTVDNFANDILHLQLGPM